MLTKVKIDLGAIAANIGEYRRMVGENVKIMGIVKSNAYGHGILEVADFIKDKVDLIGIVNLDEAIKLIKAEIKARFFVLSFWELAEKEDITLAIKNNVSFPVYRKEMIDKLDEIAGENNFSASVYLKIDTGAGRVGILETDIDEYLEYISSKNNLNLKGVYSHFASSEENFEYTQAQLNRFKKIKAHIDEKYEGLEYHFACSAATFVLQDEGTFNMIRLGVGMYGLWPDKSLKPHFGHKITLRPALSWETSFIHIKKIPAGSYIGYGNTYKTERDTVLGVLPVGYWDGYDRKLSNSGEVVIKGQKCPVLGRICMNLTMVDLTDVEGVSYDDKVLLLGEGQAAEDLADKIGTINYEVVTRINAEIPRVYIK